MCASLFVIALKLYARRRCKHKSIHAHKYILTRCASKEPKAIHYAEQQVQQMQHKAEEQIVLIADMKYRSLTNRC